MENMIFPMDKAKLMDKTERLLAATEQAGQWVSRNDVRVRSCGNNVAEVLARLRRQARYLRKLKRAIARKMCVGVFGPSQAGKSYLLSSLARDDNNSVRCLFPNAPTQDFVRDMNPSGGKESTGLVTRFTMDMPSNMPEGFPVHVRLLSETELVKIFANTYFEDGKPTTRVDREAIGRAVAALKERQGQGSAHITLDALEDLREYISKSFGGNTRADVLEEAYWPEVLNLAPKLDLEDRAELFGIIWDNIPEFDDMFLELSRDLERLGNPEEAFCAMDALVPRSASIIDVETLGKTDFGKVRPEIAMCTREGRMANIRRKNATALVAELTIVMEKKPAKYFDHTDLLDFPGYKGRLECEDIRKYLGEDKKDGSVEQFFRRGKVAYLFQRYNEERELTSLLLCVAGTDNIPGLPRAVEEWVIATHGKTPEERQKSQNALFYILTKSDELFVEKIGVDIDAHWDDILMGRFISHFGSSHSQATRWVDEWIPGHAFDNLFLLRNINVHWDKMEFTSSAHDAREVRIDPKYNVHMERMRLAFLKSELVRRHFRSPQEALQEVTAANNGGIELIKSQLEPVCKPELKLGQVALGLDTVQHELLVILERFFISGDRNEELRKKIGTYIRLGTLRKRNRAFEEHFPGLLNSFRMAPDRAFYLHSEAEQRYNEYREQQTSVQEDKEEFAGVDDLMDVLDFNDDAPSPGETTGNPSEKDENSFYAERIVEAWRSDMRAMVERPECGDYYQIDAPTFLDMVKEFEIAAARMGLQARLEQKFREIDQPSDVSREKKIRRQASYAVGVLNDVISWMGKKPAETSEQERTVTVQGKTIHVFEDKPPVQGIPVLPENGNATNLVRNWSRDWLLAFYGMLEENVSFVDGQNLNLQENMLIGEIIKQIKGNEV